MSHEHYPSAAEVDQWSGDLLARADATEFDAAILEVDPAPGVAHTRHVAGAFVRFTAEAFDPFFGYWQPVASGGPAPLLVHLPGYGAEFSAHPQLVEAGFNVLHVNPQGYFTPDGPDTTKLRGDSWPVLPDTITTLGQRGYVDWFRDALVAVRWALAQPAVQPDRLGFFGTSQGGGTALMLASIMAGRGVKAVAADEPFLTNFPLARTLGLPAGAYDLAAGALATIDPARLPAAWRALGLADTISHAGRLTIPTLLTAGAVDEVCPPATIRSLFDLLPAGRAYVELADQAHGYTVPFISLAKAWFGVYV